MCLEAYTYLRHHRTTLVVAGSSQFNGVDKVFLAICTQHTDGELTACQHNGFAQAFEHERQGTRRVSHRVGPMQNDKAVRLFVVLGNDIHQLGPQLWVHVGGVNRRFELVRLQFVVKQPQFGHMILQVLEVERLQSTRFRIPNHADGASCIDKQNAADTIHYSFE